MKKNIGILTFHSCFNFGAVLQAYALQRTIENLGYENEIINYRSKILTNINNVFAKDMRHPKEVVKNLTRLPYYNELHIRQEYFEDFINNTLKVSRRLETEEEVENACKTYNAVICGSDQTWNLHDSARYQNPVYMMNFPKQQMRFAYAASFGDDLKAAYKYQEIIRSCMQTFDLLGIREQEGVDYLNDMGFKSQLVLDPTLLLDEHEWLNICDQEKQIKEPYILVFTWTGPRYIINLAKQISKQLGIKVCLLSTPPRAMFSGLPRKLDIGPKQFLKLVQDAEFVITNSFHGTVFSIIFKKPFVTVPDDHPDFRRRTLLHNLGLEKHMVRNVTSEQIEVIHKFDYTTIEKKIQSLRQNSMEYLKEILQHVDNEVEKNDQL